MTQFDEQLNCIKINCDQYCFSELEQFQHNIHQRLQDFDYQISQLIEKEHHIQEESSKLLSDLDSINPLLSKLTAEIESYETLFNETESTENFVKLHQQIKQIQNEVSLFNSTKLQQLNESIQQYTNSNIRDESTQLSTTLMNINNRYRVLTQDLNRFLERIDERIECETNNSMKVIENLSKVYELN